MSEPRRVAIVSPYDLAVPGGVQGQVSGLADALVRLGVTVQIISPGTADSPSHQHGDVGITTVGRVIPIPVNGSRAPISPYPQAMIAGVRALTAFHPNIVHLHEPFVPGPCLAACVVHRWPTIATFHRSGAGLGYRAIGPLLRVLMRRIDDVVGVSDAALATVGAVTRQPTSNGSIIENGVDVHRFADATPWGKRKPTVVFAGRHEARKGLAVLLEAFAGVEIDADLWVIGEGPETRHLKDRFAGDGRISWCGRCDDAELARRVRAADVFVAPSLRGESFGVVLSEAMAAGVAVIASDLPGYRLAARAAALYVPPGDDAALRLAITGFLTDANLREQHRAAGLTRARELDFSIAAQRYLEHYERLLGSNTTP